MRTATTAILLAALLAAGCSRARSDGEPVDLWVPENQGAVVSDIEKRAPPLVSQEVLRGCDEWHSLDRPCRDADVRVHALECWVERGRAAMEFAYRANTRQRPRDQKILRAQDECMFERGWRKNPVAAGR